MEEIVLSFEKARGGSNVGAGNICPYYGAALQSGH